MVSARSSSSSISSSSNSASSASVVVVVVVVVVAVVVVVVVAVVRHTNIIPILQQLWLPSQLCGLPASPGFTVHATKNANSRQL